MINNPTTVNVVSNPPIAGNVTLTQGTNVTLTQSGNNITITASAAGTTHYQILSKMMIGV